MLLGKLSVESEWYISHKLVAPSWLSTTMSPRGCPMPPSRALSRRSALRGAAVALLAVWLLRELQWLRRWRAYWRALQHQMITTIL